MATQDVIDTAVASLQALAQPTANTTATSLRTQIATLQGQLTALQAQLVAAEGADAQDAKQVIRFLKQVLPNRVKGLSKASPAG